MFILLSGMTALSPVECVCINTAWLNNLCIFWKRSNQYRLQYCSAFLYLALKQKYKIYVCGQKERIYFFSFNRQGMLHTAVSNLFCFVWKKLFSAYLLIYVALLESRKRFLCWFWVLFIFYLCSLYYNCLLTGYLHNCHWLSFLGFF